MTHEGTPPTRDADLGRPHSGKRPRSAWRILLAHNLSPAADRATDAIANADWPPTTVVRIVSNPVGIGPMLSSFANLRETRAHARMVQEMIAQAHARLAAAVEASGAAVETRVVGGRPGSSIVAEARRFDADLIVAGARDQGAIAATLLGSVSRAIVESARCSVLIARGRDLTRVLLATDGSSAARAATEIVATAPLFDGARVHVIAVDEDGPRYPGIMLSDVELDEAMSSTARGIAERGNSVADEAATELMAHGRDVGQELRLGDAATEIVAAAQEWLPDVVVIGCNAEPLLRRLFLGSVARKVIDGVSSSVLVARVRVNGRTQASSQ